MDFKTKTASVADLDTLATDALLLVVCGSELPAGWSGPLGQAVRRAVDAGDLTLKGGQCIYLHQVAGVKAARVVVAVAADRTPKAVAQAAALAVTAVKSGGARQAALAVAAEDGMDEAQAQALVPAVADAMYQYRHTKPSAPPPAASISRA